MANGSLGLYPANTKKKQYLGQGVLCVCAPQKQNITQKTHHTKISLEATCTEGFPNTKDKGGEGTWSEKMPECCREIEPHKKTTPARSRHVFHAKKHSSTRDYTNDCKGIRMSNRVQYSSAAVWASNIDSRVTTLQDEI